jgi:endonuclease YncB( thermonuclease family)
VGILGLVLAVLVLAAPPSAGAEERVPDGAERVELVQVIDGDTFDADFELGRGERISRVRLIGIDTPETSYSYGNEPECFGEQAKAEVFRRLADAAEIWLEADVAESDDKGRLLRYAWLVDERGEVQFLNEELVRAGFAEAKSYRPNTSRQRELDRAEGDAIDANAGMWAGCDALGNSYADPVSDSDDAGGAPVADGTEGACAVFASFDDAQIFYEVFPEIADQVDPDDNGTACELYFSAAG